MLKHASGREQKTPFYKQSNKPSKIYCGTIIHPLTITTCEVVSDGGLAVDANGRVVGILSAQELKELEDVPVVDYSGRIIVPGFVDCHVHLPQYSLAGLGAGELLQWLDRYTFPAETRFADRTFARQNAELFFDELSAVGTTTSCVYSTVHAHAAHEAFVAAEARGVRALIGQVVMERRAPAVLLQDYRSTLKESEQLIKDWHGTDRDRLQFAVTPRFAISCAAEALRACAELAAQYGVSIQSHLSENRGEIGLVHKLFPDAKSYTDVYDRAGLLTEKSLFGHCVHLSAEEVQLMAERKAVAVHCPTSNRYLQSGVFPLRKLEQAGVRIALGSDVGGGYNLCMLQEMREAIETSKTWNIFHPDDSQEILSTESALYYATLGGARALGRDHCIGNFAEQREADFVVLDDSAVNPFSRECGSNEPIDRLTRLIYRGARSDIEAVFVRGRCVSQRSGRGDCSHV